MKIPTSDEEERKKNMRNTPGPMLNPSFGVSSGDGSSASSAKSWNGEQVDRHLRDNYPNVHHERGRADRDAPQMRPQDLSKSDREALARVQAETSRTKERLDETKAEYRQAVEDRQYTRDTGKVVHPETREELRGMSARVVRFQQDGRVEQAGKDVITSQRYHDGSLRREAETRENIQNGIASREQARAAKASNPSDQLRAATQQSSQQSAQAQERTQTQGQKRAAPTSTNEPNQTTSQPKSNASANPSDRLRTATQQSSQQSAQAQTRAANAPARGQDDEHRRR